MAAKQKPPGHLHERVYVKVDDLPSFSDLQRSVSAVVNNSSLWERYGVDWTIMCVGLCGYATGFYLISSTQWRVIASGLTILGLAHGVLTAKSAHLASHDALFPWPVVNHVVGGKIFQELFGSFSSYLGDETHVKFHHPHTNIVGLGDSSSWKVPSLSRHTYMFIAPLCLPLAIPLLAIYQLRDNWRELLKLLPTLLGGLVAVFYILMSVCGHNLFGALLCFQVYRSLLSIPFIHINIFQHIGLPMFSPKDRPARVYQMSHGVLNLSRNTALDYLFGHSLINCHVEHHLFPKLSDNMCLKIKPIVSRYLKEHNLPYQERSYSERLALFIEKYDELMVDAPPITHFIGLQ